MSETTRPIALIFGMNHYPVVLYPVFFSNYIPGAQNYTTPVGHMLYILGLNREEHEKIFLS